MSGFSLDVARAHAPVLVLALLLCGAALALMLPQRRMSWLAALGASAAALLVAGDMAARVLLGGAPVPGGEVSAALAPDGVGVFAAALIVLLLSMSLLAAAPVVGALNRAAPHAMALTLAAAAGWIGALFAADLTGVVIGAQVGWLASVGLVGIAGDNSRGALNGALRMWTAGGVAAALMLLGLGLVARGVGHSAVAAAASAHIAAPTMAIMGFVLLLLPLASAAGLAPLHQWVGAAYGRVNGFVATVLATVTAIGAAAVLTRASAFVASAPAIAEGVDAALVVLGVASVVIGAVQAVGAVNVQRLVAYAGATQGGCVLLAIALGSPAGFAAALIQLTAWAAASLALLAGATRGADLAALDGLVRRAPLTSVAITVGALSMMGAPLTIGFLGRWRLIEASVGAGWWWATGAAILASLAAVFYGGKLIERIYFRRANETAEAERDLWRFVRAPASLVALAAIVIGLSPEPLLRAAARAAALVLGHGP